MQNIQVEDQAAKKEHNAKDKGLMKISEAMADYQTVISKPQNILMIHNNDMKEERFTGT